METSRILTQIQTPFDDIIPVVDDPAARFYIDAMRIYLGLSAGTLSFDEAVEAVEVLKKNPEFVRYPTNPIQIPINDYYTKKILENLKTLKKFNLVTTDSVRSAYSFVFLPQEPSISPVDSNVLNELAQTPLNSISNVAKTLELSPRTISRSLDRLTERHSVRYRAVLDISAWNINTVLVFFTPQTGQDWPSIEDEIIKFPLIKTMLKTTMTDLGYLSITFPGDTSHIRTFINNTKKLSGSIFDYMSIHNEQRIGTEYNLSLYKDGKWAFPNAAKIILEDENTQIPETPPRHVITGGARTGLTQVDFEIASIAKLMARATPSEISHELERRDLNIEPKKVTSTLRKLYSKKIMEPYIQFNLGLSSNFCFEIICNEEWKERILSVLPLLPYTMFFVSQRGIVLWLSSPGYHQVEYYQLFRSLEEYDGVKSVKSIMTIRQKGSRTILDLTDTWDFARGRFSIPARDLDFSKFVL
ncbi:MAG: hypothetical protein ACW98Y_06125 [Candidatus Thorarchaeota archaeon]|jgi:DNA-binding Lrp family transcriptional regulator